MNALFWQGVVIGFGIAMPVGPIGFLVVQRGLSGGFAHGFLSGMGAAVADAIYGAIGAFGVTAISGLLIEWQWAFRLFGGGFLIWLGIQAFRRSGAVQAAEASRGGAFFSVVLLTLANPATILSFAAIFSGIVPAGSTGAGAGIVVLGVFLGSAAWWLFLAGLTSLTRHAVDEKVMRWISRGSGVILIAFALYALSGLVL